MKKGHTLLKKCFCKIVMSLFCLLSFYSICGAASLPDIGMITRLSGKINYWNKTVNEKTKPAEGFMKVRPDDEFKLTTDSELQLIFFSNGRKEVWKGPAKLKLGKTGGELTDGNNKNNKLEVTQLPSAVVNEVRRISPLIDPTKLHRSGSSAVRGVNKISKTPIEKIALKSADLDIEEKEEIDAVKQIYKTLLTSSSSDDITPELYLFSVLADYDQFNDIKELIIKMKKKQPENPGVEQLTQWLREQAEVQNQKG